MNGEQNNIRCLPANGSVEVESRDSLMTRAPIEERREPGLALQIYAKVVHLYCDVDGWSRLKTMIMRHKHSDEEKQQLTLKMDTHDSSVIFVVGLMTMFGMGGYQKDPDQAYTLLSRASSLGHAYATRMCGWCFNSHARGVKRDFGQARALFMKACAQGCFDAGRLAGDMFSSGKGGPKDLFMAALYYRKSGGIMKEPLASLMKDDRMAVAPWSRWEPSPEIHYFVPPQVHAAMRIWMLVAKRSPLPKDLHKIVTSYVSTQNGW